MVSVIRYTDTSAKTEIALDSQIPLIDIRVAIFDIRRELEALRSGLRKVGRERAGQGQARRAIDDGIGETADIARLHRPPGARERPEHGFNETAVASANHGFSVFERTPCEPDAGSKAGLIRIMKLVWQSRLAGRKDWSRRNGSGEL